ncbi:MAG: SCO family protein [Bacillota bacterium]
MRRGKPFAAGIAAWVLLGAAAAVAFALTRPATPELRGMAVTPPYPVADFTLTDQWGRPFQLASLRGKAVLMFFGYTFCPDVCPATMLQYKGIRQALGRDTERVALLFISVDPERDTPGRLREYLGYFDAAILGLTGTPQAVSQVTAQYGVVAEKVPVPGSGAGYLMNHTALIYLIGPSGQMRAMFPHGSKVEDIVHDVRLVLREPVKAQRPADAGQVARAATSGGEQPPPAAPAYGGTVHVEGAWARPAPGMGATSAVYMTLVNRGDRPDALVAVRSDVARAIELHETRIENNVMRMRRVERIEVPPGGRVQLTPGGLHAMLIGLTRKLEEGDRFQAVLVFEHGGELTIEIPVRQPGP